MRFHRLLRIRAGLTLTQLTAPQTKEVIEDDIELNDLPSFSVKEGCVQIESEPEELEEVAESEVPNFELTDEQKRKSRWL